jgi:hypothetical protein
MIIGGAEVSCEWETTATATVPQTKTVAASKEAVK